MNSFYLNREIITRSRTITMVGCMLAAFIVAISTSTSVSAQAPEVLIIGSHGNGTGQFNDPAGIVIDPKGYLFVVDSLNNRIQKFTSNGTFVSQWGTFGDGPGNFNDPLGITLDYTSGFVYVTDTGNDRIQKFTSNGTFVSQWGNSGSGNGQSI